MTYAYLVHVMNEYSEDMTFRFKELHDALILYRTAKHDVSVTLASVDCVEFDENEPDIFTDSDNIGYYERD